MRLSCMLWHAYAWTYASLARLRIFQGLCGPSILLLPPPWTGILIGGAQAVASGCSVVASRAGDGGDCG